MNQFELLIALASSGLLGMLTQILGRVVAASIRAKKDRETAVQKAEREAAEWELVARCARRLAVDAGVDPKELPTGPGEDPSWKGK